MKERLFALWALTFLLALSSQLSTIFAQGTAFTYQGRLNDGGGPANGSYDLTFVLFPTSSGGSAVTAFLVHSAVGVSNGLFSVNLDFGAGVFNGTSYWLEIGVRTNGNGSYNTLAPRQQLTPAPYAIYAEGASAAGLSGTVPAAALAGSYGNALALNNANNSFRGTFVGNGAELIYVNAATLNGLNASSFWNTTGNAGTVPGVNFVGTTDTQPLELRVNGQRAQRFELNTDAPNVIGGASINAAGPGVAGVTIAGGGSFTTYGGGGPGPPSPNLAGSSQATIGGGLDNSIGTNSAETTIAGGGANTVESGSADAFIGGGSLNLIRASASYSAIVGGSGNDVQAGGYAAFIGGGTGNAIQTSAGYSAIVGGLGNVVQDGVGTAFIGGGAHNQIQTTCYESTIGGGFGNVIQTNAAGSVIGGGSHNYVRFGDKATIAGGYQNLAGNAAASTGRYTAVGGGFANNAEGDYATVPGGSLNWAPGSYSLAAGRQAKAQAPGAFAWADSQASDFNVTNQDSVNFRCQGGVRFTSDANGQNQTVSWAPGAGSWSFTSDRNAKENFKPVDTQQVLQKIAQLPLLEWSYKGYGERHVGPMAQDFHAAFPFNPNDKMINSADEAGVSLAAIQGLNEKVESGKQKVESLEQKLEQKETEITELKQRLQRLEQLLDRKFDGATR